MVSSVVSNQNERLVTNRVDNDDVELDQESAHSARKSRVGVYTRRLLTVLFFLLFLVASALVSYFLVTKYRTLMEFRYNLKEHITTEFPNLDNTKTRAYMKELSSLFRQGLISKDAKLEFEVYREFESYNTKYKRTHLDETERHNKLSNFRKTYLDVKSQKGDEPYQKGLNRFSDLSDKEFYEMFPPMEVPQKEVLPTEAEWNTLYSNATYLKNLKLAKGTDEELDPKTVTGEDLDWRRAKSVSSVKDQQNCGACWAFSTVAAVESLFLSHHDLSYELSPQELLDCDAYSNGCKGGFLDSAFEYARKHGLVSASDLPYVERANQCSVPRAHKVFVGGTYVFKGKQLLNKSLPLTPTSVYVAVSPELTKYKSGVYTGPCGYSMNHALLLVGEGYDTELKKRFWVLKNSWGTDWGEDGYLRLERTDVGTDKCSVLDTGFTPYLTVPPHGPRAN